uniref:Uncharacterized protein n=1 Tax=Periophthalmus magnuspinnatus TaxID=409849 RepID=A0A3B4BF68_9GOBI
MNRKRGLISDAFISKRKKAVTERFGLSDVEGTYMKQIYQLVLRFVRLIYHVGVSYDTQIVLKHQLYSLVSDKTMVDKGVNKLREQGDLLMFQLGFDSEAFGLVFASDYKAKVLAAQDGCDTQETVQKFLDKVLTSCTDLSFSKDQMLHNFLFSDAEITQLVKSGVLTVRDAGSWWLSIPNSGKFTKYFIQGRKAVLNMIKKSKYNEVLKVDLEDRKTPSQVKFHMKYHIHDIVGAELVESIPTTSGTLLRYVDD